MLFASFLHRGGSTSIIWQWWQQDKGNERGELLEKSKLIKRAESVEMHSKERTLMLGYPKEKYREIAKASAAIIKAICNIENLTPKDAELALKMAGDIIESEMKNELIS